MAKYGSEQDGISVFIIACGSKACISHTSTCKEYAGVIPGVFFVEANGLCSKKQFALFIASEFFHDLKLFNSYGKRALYGLALERYATGDECCTGSYCRDHAGIVYRCN